MRAGLVYAVSVFGVGFALGTVRMLLLAPRVGASAAVLMEAPVMLIASWWVSWRCISHFRVPATPGARALMGAVAFIVLMLEELTLALVVFGDSPARYGSSFATLPGAIGLAAQVAFACIPLAQRQDLLCRSMRSRNASS